MTATLTDLLWPVDPAAFSRTYFDRKPVYLQAGNGAGSARREMLSWDRLAAALAVRSHWVGDRAQMILNSRPIDPEHFLETPTFPNEIRAADPAKVANFLAMGASLVANGLEDVDAGVRDVCVVLSRAFGARTGANAYASSGGIQAFASHCDLHDVLAVQTEGRKRWRIYRYRADHPVAQIEGPDAQTIIDRAKGPVLLDLVMEPGDALYIPRGFYHDAIAEPGRSLHLTFSILPATGRMVLSALEQIALVDPAFRAYLPDVSANGGDDLREALTGLAYRLAEMARSPAMLTAIAQRQGWQQVRSRGTDLNTLPELRWFARTARGADVTDGMLRSATGTWELHGLDDAADWLISKPLFADRELAARFPWHSADRLHALIEQAQRMGLCAPHRPEL